MTRPRRWNDLRSDTAPLEGVIHSFLLHRHDLSARTVENYTYNLRRFREWCEETMSRQAVIADIEPGTVNAFLAHRRATGTASRSRWVGGTSCARHILG